MATAGFIVSLCAIGLSIWQGLLTRRHNRLSVRPYLVSTWHKRREKDGLYLSYSLENVGIGPAILRTFELTAKDWKRSREEVSVVEELVGNALGKLQYHLKQHSLPGSGYALRAHEKYPVGEVYVPSTDLEVEKRVEAALREIFIDVTYDSFYRERYRFPGNERVWRSQWDRRSGFLD